MAKLNWEKANQRSKALDDVREALEEGAVDDVYVIIDSSVPPKDKGATSRPRKRTSRAKKQTLYQQHVERDFDRHAAKTKQQPRFVSSSKVTDPTPPQNRRTVAKQKVTANKLKSAPKAELQTDANQSVSEFKELLNHNAGQPSQITHAELLNRIHQPNNTFLSFKPFRMSAAERCVCCPAKLRAGRNHFIIPSLQCFVCCPCASAMKKLVNKERRRLGLPTPRKAKPSPKRKRKYKQKGKRKTGLKPDGQLSAQIPRRSYSRHSRVRLIS